MNHPRRALVLAEVLALLTMTALLAAVLTIGAAEPRRQSSLGDNLANLRQFAAGTATYAADNDDRFWTFTWEPGVVYVPGYPFTLNPITAAANQAWHILRTRSGRPDWFGFSTPNSWLPHINYSHLVLLDYLDGSFPARFTAGPEDHQRLLWQSDPFEGFMALPEGVRPPGGGTGDRRWPFSSSYTVTSAATSPDARVGAVRTLAMEGSHNVWTGLGANDARLGRRRLWEMAFPARKVLLHEQYQRHFGPRIAFFAYPEARIPLMLADGSAAVRLTSDANPGFPPNAPLSPSPQAFRYSPGSWEPPTLSGNTSDELVAHYRHTRSGLRGRDFGGPEVPWTE